MRLLVDAGADINCRVETGLTPLLQATRRRDVEPVVLLLQLGADPTVHGANGRSALEHARDGATQQVLAFAMSHAEQLTDADTGEIYVRVPAERLADWSHGSGLER